MNTRTLAFLITLFFIIGLVLGFSIRKKPIIIKEPSVTIRDTVITVRVDTIRVLVDRIKYFTKTDTMIVNRIPVISDSAKCVSFPLLLSDSSVISVTECSNSVIPNDLSFKAQYIDKREKVRVVENTRIDTVRLESRAKRMGFTLGPSAGIGIDVNNIRQPVYFIGATLTYGWRF